ncbi:hypothetical protein BDZ89DRAFT_1117068 [Hymenopellis radicata]|nr:hypothetical protein BDZ89DRAFT_1117068 [Hymenopellis radicata]
MATNSSSPMAIGEMFGPPLVGIMISCMLFGSMCNQCLLYFTRYPKDQLWVKSYVATLLLLDLVGTILAIWWIYDLLVTNFAVYQALFIVTFRLAIHPALVGLQATLCQVFFIWRIRVLTQKLWLCVPLFFGCLVNMGCTIQSLYQVLRPGASYDGRNLARNHSVRRPTVQNGLVTSACTVVELAAFLGLPHSGLHMAFVFLLPKVYCNAVMSSLNARARASQNLTKASIWI